MNKIKGIRLILFITCLTLGIALYGINDSPGSSASNIGQVSEVSSKTYANQQIAFLNEQDNNDRSITSRGTRNRDIDKRVNQIEKPVTTAETETPTPAAQTEVKPAAPAEPIKTAAQPAAPAKVSANTETKAVQSTPAKAPSQYENDLDLLARLITAEAQGEPYDAKVAVGAVVMNRVKSGLWANTIKDVIYQKFDGYYQFTPVVNGWINKPAEAESIQAAKAAMSGADPTNGAQFYYDDSVTNTWILSKPVAVQIGHMIYAY